jgi:GNAT superfamily N-acetyltransferase
MEPYLLTADQAGVAGTLLATAFFPSPVATFLFPDPVRRALLHPLFFTAMTRVVARSGEATALGKPPHAVALWLPPTREHPTEANFAGTEWGEAEALLDEGEAERVGALLDHLGTHHRVMNQPHWYLPFLAVAPELQGQGAGTVLMRHMLNRVASSIVPCYLDSADVANLPFYERFGFRVVEAGVVPGSHLHTWALRRDSNS